ncbi:MAG: hypothetical protein OEL53_08160, partial [Rhodospirillales bacterium]|nr:hypothetical protein [Rhodospirillales bacterium]
RRPLALELEIRRRLGQKSGINLAAICRAPSIVCGRVAHRMVTLRNAFTKEVKAGKHGAILAAGFAERGWKAPGIEGNFRVFTATMIMY